MSSSEPTINLVQRAQAGDREALEQLFARYYDRVRRIIGIRMGPRVRSWTDSVDIMSRTLMKAMQKLGTFEMSNETALLRWLVKIAEGMIRDAVDERNAARRNPDRESPAAFDMPASTTTFTTRLERDEDRELVDRGIAALSATDRELLLDHYYYGMGWQQIAEAEGGVTPDAIRMRASEARARLLIQLQRLRRAGGGAEDALT